MKINSFAFLAALLSIFVVVGAGGGCGGNGSSDSLSNTEMMVTVSPPPAPVIPEPSSLSCRPVRIAKLFDQSGSMGWTDTKRVKVDDLKPVLPLLLRCGGEMGVTFVRSESNRPMLRFLIPEPKTTPAPLEPRGEDEEPYKFADRKRKFDKELSDWKNEQTERERTYGQKFADFLSAVEPVLNAAPNGKTDLWGAVRRAKIMLSESDVVWTRESRPYLVLVTDAVDTIGKPKVNLDEKIKVFWVDSKSDDSVLKELRAERFESFKSALENILAIEGEKDNEGR